MAITISGSGITSANIADGTIVNADVADVAASKLTGALPAIDGSSLTGISGGKVLQVQSSFMNAYASTTSTTFVDTGLTVNITPTSTTSKILIFVNMPSNHPGQYGSWFNLVRNGTNIAQGSGANAVQCSFGTLNQSGDEYDISQGNLNYLDSPSTTTAITYKIQYRTGTNGTLCINANKTNSGGTNADFANVTSNITVQEIGA
jgi:hypothetical protein